MVAALLGLLALAACELGTDPDYIGQVLDGGPLPPAPPAEVVDAGGLALAGSAHVRLVEERTLAIWPTVRAINATAVAVPLEPMCVVQIRVAGATKDGRVAEWSGPESPLATCAAQNPTTLAAGRMVEVGPRVEAQTPRLRDVMGDSIVPGFANVSLVVRVGAETVVVPAGRVTLARDNGEADRDPMRLRWATSVHVEGATPREIVMRVIGANGSDRMVHLKGSGCYERIRVFRTPDLAGPPAWQSGGDGVVCAASLTGYAIPPGEWVVFEHRIRVRAILGDSLPADRYYFTRETRFIGEDGDDDSILRLRLGGVFLDLDEVPLPRERVVDGIRYRADSELDAGTPGMVRVTVIATNTGAERALLVEAGNPCSLGLSAYATSADRDRWYERGAAWTAPACPLRIAPTWLAAGESRAFSFLVPLDAGPFGGGLRPAPFALVDVRWGRAFGAGGRIVLSAGEPL